MRMCDKGILGLFDLSFLGKPIVFGQMPVIQVLHLDLRMGHRLAAALHNTPKDFAGP